VPQRAILNKVSDLTIQQVCRTPSLFESFARGFSGIFLTLMIFLRVSTLLRIPLKLSIKWSIKTEGGKANRLRPHFFILRND
jgi:hypothetical protein